MKKLVFMFAAVVAVSFASCGGSTEATECTVDSDSIAAAEAAAVVDSAAALLDSAAAVADTLGAE